VLHLPRSHLRFRSKDFGSWLVLTRRFAELLIECEEDRTTGLSCSACSLATRSRPLALYRTRQGFVAWTARV
jgi:hypothetical protein